MKKHILNLSFILLIGGISTHKLMAQLPKNN